MGNLKVGDRVGAFLSVEGIEVHLIGFGTYEGVELPPKGLSAFTDMVNEQGHKTPKIKLDSGGFIWGCECWWGLEKEVKQFMKHERMRIVPADIRKERRKSKATWN